MVCSVLLPNSHEQSRNNLKRNERVWWLAPYFQCRAPLIQSLVGELGAHLPYNMCTTLPPPTPISPAPQKEQDLAKKAVKTLLRKIKRKFE